MALLPVLRALQKFEQGISITDPFEIKNPAAYLVGAPSAIGKARAVFENRIANGALEARMGRMREDTVTIMVRFMAFDANFNDACEIAVAFFDATWLAFDEQRQEGQRFDRTVDYFVMRTEQEVPINFGPAKGGHPGWEIFLDCTLFDEVLN